LIPPKHIFREYDIRGIVGEDLTVEVVREVGQAYGCILRGSLEDEGVSRNPVVAVGGDNRPSSGQLSVALIAGLNASGADVIYLGTVPTPVAYWAESELGADGVIQITGSHNPPEWNGIKMTLRGRPFYGAAIQALHSRIERQDYFSGTGSTREIPLLDRYVKDLAPRFHLSRPIRAVVDCGNGTGSVVAVDLLEAIGVEVTPLFCESDGTFPNHHPDPSVDHNMEDVIREVKASGADLGIAFDGDADRLGAVDEQGRVIRADLLLLLFGLDLLKRRGPGQLMVYDVKCSQALPEVFEAAGGRTLMWKTGHSLIKEKMMETGAPIGGELSGHICFADDFIGSDDALYAACRLAALLSSSDEPLSSLIDAFPRYASTPEIRIDLTEETKKSLVSAALEHFGSRYEVIGVDGVRVLFPGGWALLRASNTQPVVVARFEAVNEERLSEIRGEVEAWLRLQGVHV
jgi:phosphomannomutase/phosphoglucomutase